MNARSAQLIAIVLAFLLMLLILVTLFVLLNRPFSPSPSASPTGVAVLSPSPLPSLPGETPTLAPGVTPSPEPTASPLPTETIGPSSVPSPLPSPTVSPSPTPSPTPIPTVNPTTTQREFRLLSVGLDSRLADGWVERIVTFTVEGQSLLEARVSEASASGVRICLWREAVNDERECRSGRNMVLTRPVLDAGFSTWHVSLVGPREPVSPHVNLTLRFNASQPAIELDNFRYVGTSAADYNGFLAQFGTGSQGGIRVIASFEDGEGGDYPYHLIIGPVGDAPTYDQTPPGEVSGFDIIHSINAAGDWRVELRNPDEFAAGGLLPVFVHAELRWP